MLLTGMCIFLAGCGVSMGPDDLFFDNPDQAIIDSRKMIADKNQHPEKYTNWIYSQNLPESLRIPHLKYAMVYDDHINLVLTRNPDWILGARIWSKNASKNHQDKVSRYKEIYFFQYTNDLPESPENIK